MRTPGDVVPGWDAAMAARRPVVVEAFTDPEVPPLPPHIRLEQAHELAKAALHGERATGRIMAESLKGKLAELLTR